MLPIPVLETEFDVQVQKLGLTQSKYVSSFELWNWCHRNRNRVYVPEWLLAEWGMQVEDTFSDGGNHTPNRARARHFHAA
jgi:hypothetical protein